MKTKLQPTLRTKAGLLVGDKARDAWALQDAYCNCGGWGTADEIIFGECRNMPAEWLGCNQCRGQALGIPLVYAPAGGAT